MAEQHDPISSSTSGGVTATERMLAEFCERSFLKLWSYPNPYKDDGHELCDLLAVFENHVFIFFDRENRLDPTPVKDPDVLWDRWKRNVIDRQVKTAHGAERYIRGKRPVYLDGKRTKLFPLHIDTDRMIVHKIIVAHGAKEACEQASASNIYGSLAISYGPADGASPSFPFFIDIDRKNPVHVFDSHNLPIVLGELDTVYDFSRYLDAKLEAIAKYQFLTYCGEEDLLAHYLLNLDESSKEHFIGTKDLTINSVTVGEGEWHDFHKSKTYQATKDANRISYMWDELIQRTCQNALDGTLMGHADLHRGPSAILEMAKEPRFIRRTIAERFFKSIEEFPDNAGALVRKVSYVPSFYKGKGYVFLQLKVDAARHDASDYREKRQAILEIACGAAKNKMPELNIIIGIGIDAPKFYKENSEDFILMRCDEWPEGRRREYDERNQGWDFFQTAQLKEHREHVTEFVAPPTAKARPVAPTVRSTKVRRNDPCPCGSDKKFKKCCGP